MQRFVKSCIYTMLLSIMSLTAYSNDPISDQSCVKLDKELCDFICTSKRLLQEGNIQPSSSLIRCCQMIENGCDELTTTDLYEALPDLAKSMLTWGARAPRPASDLVVGDNYSNQDQIIGLLNQVLCRLQDCLDTNSTFSDCCQEILITLTEINTTLTSCCNDIVETLTVDIVNSLTEIITTLTECCSTIETLSLLFTSSCQTTPIFDAITITTPGIYCLANFIDGTIVIASDDVDLDLNNYRIAGGTNGIVVDPGFARIAIHDGQIGDTTDQAILIGDGASQITIENIEIDGAGNATIPWAIEFQGTGATRISEGLIRNVRIFDSASGIYLQNADHVQVVDCKVVDITNTTTAVGIFIFGDIGTPASCNEVINCQVCGCTSTDLAAAGIVVWNGVDVVFDNCHVGAITGLVFSIGIEAAVSPGTVIANCSAIDIAPLTDDGALACLGIWLVSSPNSIVKNCSTIDLGDDLTVPTFGIMVGSSEQSLIENVEVSNILSTTLSAGIFIDSSSPSCIIQRGIITNVAGATEAEGIGIWADNVICQNCEVTDVAGILADAFHLNNNGSIIQASSAFTGQIALAVGDIVDSDIVRDCACVNIQGSLRGRGFYVNGFNTYIGNCVALNIQGQIEAEGGTGYEATETSTLVLFDNCITENVSEDGFLTTGADTQFQYCTAKNCGDTGFLAFSPGANGIIDHCYATECGIGFFAPALFGNRVTNCYAANNTSNYVIDPIAVVSVGGVPVVGVNIDV